MNETTVYGWDRIGYGVGDRIEIHPGTDMWMRGARFGVVSQIKYTVGFTEWTIFGDWKVEVTLDKTGSRVWRGPADRFRRIN